MGLTEKAAIKPLSAQEAKQFLVQVPEWKLSDDAKKIFRHYTFSNFKKALAFVNQVGEIAEAAKHHPDIALGWGYVHIEIQTHTINGLREGDFALAAKIDAVG